MPDTCPCLRLNNKAYPYQEPVLRDLRRIIDLYNAIATAEPHRQAAHIQAILNLLLGKQAPSVRRIATDDMVAFLVSLPGLLGLDGDTDDNGDGEPATWGDTYAHLAMTLGWTYDNIDQTMTLSRLKEIQPYLRKNPATHQLVAAYLEYEPEPTPEEKMRAVFNLFKAMMGKKGK